MRGIGKRLSTTAALIAAVGGIVLAGPLPANAATEEAAGAEGRSCWVSATTGESLCVEEGMDLIAEVAQEKGVQLIVPDGELVGDIKTDSARTARAAAVTSLAEAVVSIIYDDQYFGGGSLVMSVSSGSCGAGYTYSYADLGPFGWYGRVSSFKSFAGCRTAIFSSTYFAGASYGYYVEANGVGPMNDQARSWKVHS